MEIINDCILYETSEQSEIERLQILQPFLTLSLLVALCHFAVVYHGQENVYKNNK